MSSQLVKNLDVAKSSVELTHFGHEAALTCDHDELMTRLESELQARGTPSNAPIQLARCDEGLPGSVSDPNAPPVVSWIREAGLERFLLELRADLPFFTGHFPETPILPGIVQLHWATVLADRCLATGPVPQEVLRLKFRNIAVPPMLVELRLESKQGSRVEFQVLSHGNAHAQGTLVFDVGL